MPTASRLTWHIENCEKEAKEILGRYGIHDWPTDAGRKDLLETMKKFLAALDDASDKAEKADLWYAYNVLEDIHRLHCAVFSGNIEGAAAAGIVLGMNVSRMAAHPHEGAAIAGYRVKRTSADGRESEGLRLAKERKQKIYDEWVQCAAQYKARHPKHSWRQVAVYVAEKLKTGQTPETIRKKLRK